MDKIRPFLRFLVLVVLAYEAAGCLAGGALLLASPNGRPLHMPVDLMHDVFGDYLIPGAILFLLGVLNSIAFVRSVMKSAGYQYLELIALVCLLGWFWIEIAVIRQLHWLHIMWAGPVVFAFAAALANYPWKREGMRRLLLYCGIAAPLLYIIINAIVPLTSVSYSVTSQAISELSALSASTRFLWNTLCLPYTLLTAGFSFGILISAGNSRDMRQAGVLMLVYALMGLAWPFVPMHSREVIALQGESITDQLHLMLGAVNVILILAVLMVASSTFGEGFQIYSWLTFVAVAVFGTLTFMHAGKLTESLPTPWIGVWERICIGTFLLWTFVYAIMLMKRPLDRTNVLKTQ